MANTFPSEGAVGIGTQNPRHHLHIVGEDGNQLMLDNTGQSFTQMNLAANGTNVAGVAVDHRSGSEGVVIFNQGAATKHRRISFRSSGDNDDMVINNGNVGIGTTNPQERLEVEGNIVATGDVRLSGGDCAEEFNIEEGQVLDPGTVMVIGDEERLRQCREAYDTKVAGVLSGAGNCKPGILLGKQGSQSNRMPLALNGKVYCKVDAQYGTITTGDLLTTSLTPGHAMRVSDPSRASGAILGKALRPLTEGRGLIPILVALQ
jgi:hypothetical protein